MKSLKKKNSSKFILLIVSIILLSGCASIYIPPESGPKAKLGYINPGFLQMDTIIICKDPIHCKELQDLGKFKNRMTGKPTFIEANKLTTILVNHIIAGYDDVKPRAITFYPRANTTYYISTTVKDITKGTHAGGLMSTLYLLRKARGKDGQIQYKRVCFLPRKIKNIKCAGLSQCNISWAHPKKINIKALTKALKNKPEC